MKTHFNFINIHLVTMPRLLFSSLPQLLAAIRKEGINLSRISGILSSVAQSERLPVLSTIRYKKSIKEEKIY